MDAQLARDSHACDWIHLFSCVNDASLFSVLDLFTCADPATTQATSPFSATETLPKILPSSE